MGIFIGVRDRIMENTKWYAVYGGQELGFANEDQMQAQLSRGAKLVLRVTEISGTPLAPGSATNEQVVDFSAFLNMGYGLTVQEVN